MENVNEIKLRNHRRVGNFPFFKKRVALGVAAIISRTTAVAGGDFGDFVRRRFDVYAVRF